MKALALALVLVGCATAGPTPPAVVVGPVGFVAPPPIQVVETAPVVAAKTCDERDPTPFAVPTRMLRPAALTRLEATIAERTPRYAFTGSVEDVLGDGKAKRGSFTLAMKDARSIAQQIAKEVVEPNESPDWVPVALVDEAEMLERLRDALASLEPYDGPPPVPAGHIQLLTAQQAALLAQMQNSGRGALQGKADELKVAIRDFFRVAREREIEQLNETIVKAYAEAARSPQIANPARTRAIRHLAHYTFVFGEKKMIVWVPDYQPGMFVTACAQLDSR